MSKRDRGRRDLAGYLVDADEVLGVRSASELGIIRRYSCGCAVVREGSREYEQPALGCDRGEGHARELVQGVETQGGLPW